MTDRITFAASVSPELVHALTEYGSYIKGETLAVGFDLVPGAAPMDNEKSLVQDQIDQYHVKLQIERVREGERCASGSRHAW